MKRFLCLLLMAFVLARAPWPAGAAASGQISCRENRAGCRLLQLVMSGAFDQYDPDDSLNGRVLSAVYPQLCAITEEDLAHYVQEFSQEEEAVTDRCRIALANCLWANLICEPASDPSSVYVRKILLLFLEPEGQENAEEQMEEIREEMTEEVLTLMADNVGAPPAFLRWLLEEDDWEEYREGEEADS